MNLQALKEAGEKLKQGNAGEGFFSTKVLTEEGVPIRLLPEPAVLNGIFYFPVTKFWMNVNGKRTSVICSSTFGKKSIMQEEIDEAKLSDDEDVQNILADSNPQSKTALIKQEEFWMAALLLDYKTNRNNEIEKIIVVDDCAKVFQCGKATLLHEMVKVATSRKALAPTKGATDGIADRVLGSNMLLSKTGKEKATRYACVLDEQCEMDAKYYTNIPNVYEIAKAQCKNLSWQQAAIRNHIYGEPIPADVQAKEDARAEKAKATLKALFEAPTPVAKKKTAAPVDDDEDEAPKPKKKATAVLDDDDDETPVPAKKKKAAVVDDEEDDAPVPAKKKKAAVVEDDDEDELPTPKKKAVPPPPPAKKKAAVVDEDDLDEDDEEPLPKKAVAKKKAAPIDEEDEDEDEAPVPVAKKKAKPPVDDLDEEDDDAPAPVKKKAAAPAAPASKKAAAPKKSILDMLDDDDE